MLGKLPIIIWKLPNRFDANKYVAKTKYYIPSSICVNLRLPSVYMKDQIDHTEICGAANAVSSANIFYNAGFLQW